MRRIITPSLVLGLLLFVGCEREAHVEVFTPGGGSASEARQAYEKGDYARAAQHYSAAFRTDQDEVYAFNAACCFSLVGDEQSALEWLRKSLRAYFQERFNDFDLDPLRDHPEFERLEELAAAMYEAPPPAGTEAETDADRQAGETAPDELE